MKRIGLTGGIGSGKTTVAQIFKTLSIPVFEADNVSRELLQSNQLVVSEVKLLLGDDVYVNEQADRSAIAQIVFNDSSKLKALNGILHPAVFSSFQKWSDDFNDRVPYCIKEAAILFESGGSEQCDEVSSVTAPIDLRIKRVMNRDEVSKEEVEARMANQLSEQEITTKSDHIIVNDGVEALIPQVLRIHSLFS